jgi:hypothetical protein
MGLIRKTLMVSTGGAVRGSSKKQRVAKATMKYASATASNTEQANVILQRQAAILRRQAEAESAFRYSTDPVYREYIDAQRATAARLAAARRAEAAEAAAAAEAAEAARRAARNKRNAEVGWGVATYLALMVAFAVVGVFVWSAQALFSAARSQPRNLWKQDALGTAWRSAERRIREAGCPRD